MHAVQVVAPATRRVLVMEPAAQVAQAAVGAAEYLPALHAVQVVAPSTRRVLVMEPAAQAAQATVEASE